ncbi:hypothetical protein I6N57_18685, partial [Acinetobacter baumannii]|nr:hypothetical protein [Acinetobacter baumannii]
EGILLELKKEGWGILLTSHDLEVVERVSDRVAFLHPGFGLGVLWELVETEGA